MSYNFILDSYFSTYWISWGVPALLVILYFTFRHKIRKGKESTLREQVIIWGSLFVFIMLAGYVNPAWLGFGTAEGIREIRYINGDLYVVDYLMTMGSEGEAGTPCSRIHVVDPATGEKRLRFLIGEHADLINVHGDTVAVETYNDATLFSRTTGKELAHYSQETLPEYFPELSSGVNNLMWGNNGSTMAITANNGKSYDLLLDRGVLYAANTSHTHEEYVPTGQLFIDEREVKIDNERWGTRILALDGENGNQNLLYLTGRNDSILNDELTFLDGRPVAVNTSDSTCVILHYETLEKKSFVLTCVSLDGKQVMWEIHQSAYNTDYEFDDEDKPRTGYNDQTKGFCFGIASTVYCINVRNGKLLWQTEI